jgi:hypothetical protein
MPASHVQHTSGSAFSPGTSVATDPFGGTVVAGDDRYIAVFVEWPSLTITLDSVTDTGGNTYTLRDNPTPGDTSRCAMAYANIVTGGASFVVTANFSGSPTGFCDIIAHEISGLASASVLDGSSARVQLDQGEGANAIDTAAIVTTADGEYIFGAVDADGGAGSMGGTMTPGTGFTLRASHTFDLASESQIQASAGSIAVTFTQTGGGAGADYLVGIMAFKAAVVAGSITRAILSHRVPNVG